MGLGARVMAMAVMVGLVACGTGWSGGALELRHQMVERHVYGISCESLLPLIDQRLWDEGYREVEALEDGLGRQSDWVEGEEVAPHQRRVDIYYGGAERCAVHSVIREVEGGQVVERRDRDWEWELLREVEPDRANALAEQARAQGS